MASLSLLTSAAGSPVTGERTTVTIFDLKTLKTLGTIKVGTNPDAIVYDAGTKRVFTMNGRSNDATALDAASGTVVGTLRIGRQAGIRGS